MDSKNKRNATDNIGCTPERKRSFLVQNIEEEGEDVPQRQNVVLELDDNDDEEEAIDGEASVLAFTRPCTAKLSDSHQYVRAI